MVLSILVGLVGVPLLAVWFVVITIVMLAIEESSASD